MPGASFYRIESITPTIPPIEGKGLPAYVVLFGYDSSYNLNKGSILTTPLSNGNKLSNYFRVYTQLLSTAYNNKYPYNFFIRSSSASTNWNTNAGVVNPPAAQVKTAGANKLGTLLSGAEIPIADDTLTNWSGRHGYYSGPLSKYDADRPDRPAADKVVILGAVAGDLLSTTERYYPQTKSHDGHKHRVEGSDIATAIENIIVGFDLYEKTNPTYAAQNLYNWQTLGLNLLPVIPYIMDQAVGKSLTPLNTLPKGILVFGENLGSDPNITIWSRADYDPTDPPNGDYTRHDYNHLQGDLSKGESASTDTLYDAAYGSFGLASVPLYLITHHEDIGVQIPLNTSFTVRANSNTGGLHNHASTAPAFKSIRTGQSGSKLGPSGSHNHVVEYTGSIELKTKWLNGWVTLKDETPIANNIILAFSPYKARMSETTLTADNWLPLNWHFCDGTNGTPDLRGYKIAVNMYASEAGLHNTIVNNIDQLKFTSIDVAASSGEITNNWVAKDGSLSGVRQTHTHIIGADTGIGTSIRAEASHGIDSGRFHTHTPVNTSTFQELVGSTLTTYNQIDTDVYYAYTPPYVELAFIMYRSDLP